MPIRRTVLSLEEQAQIRVLKKSGLSSRAIACQLGCSHGYVNRHLRDSDGYIAAHSLEPASQTTIWRSMRMYAHICRRTMQKAARHMDFYKRARLDCARRDMGTQWDEVITSDEKMFNLDGPDAFQHYWRGLRQSPMVFSRRNFGGRSLMVYADSKQFSTVEELKRDVMTAWDNISDDVIRNFVGSMCNRVFNFIRENGGPIDC
ncbi:hypothetical protein Q1695_015691 [Nippostrongylus brasiliensis]|nr:hypothetical protein Q1695_015691 [Nippostrongylus brasiliensis]